MYSLYFKEIDMEKLIASSPAQAVVLKLMTPGTENETEAALMTLGLRRSNMTEVVIPNASITLRYDTHNFAKVNDELYVCKDEQGNYIFAWLYHQLNGYDLVSVARLNKETEAIEFPALFTPYLTLKSNSDIIGNNIEMLESVRWYRHNQTFSMNVFGRIIKGSSKDPNVVSRRSECSDIEILETQKQFSINFSGGRLSFTELSVYLEGSPIASTKEIIAMNALALPDKKQEPPSDTAYNKILELMPRCIDEHLVHNYDYFRDIDTWLELALFLENKIRDHELYIMQKRREDEEKYERERQQRLRELERIAADLKKKREEGEQREINGNAPKGPENPDNHNNFYNGLALAALLVAVLVTVLNCSGS